MTERHTITINHNAFVKLKSEGQFGETYSDLICRLVERGDSFDGVRKATK
jgi:predicted CopG family antitoxin